MRLSQNKSPSALRAVSPFSKGEPPAEEGQGEEEEHKHDLR